MVFGTGVVPQVGHSHLGVTSVGSPLVCRGPKKLWGIQLKEQLCCLKAGHWQCLYCGCEY